MLLHPRLLTRRALQGEPVSRFMRKDPLTVPPTPTLDELIEGYIYRHQYKMLPVVTDSNKVAGCVTTKEVKAVPKEEWKSKRVGDIAVTCSAENTIAPEIDAVKSFSLMHRNGASRHMVVDADRLATKVINVPSLAIRCQGSPWKKKRLVLVKSRCFVLTPDLRSLISVS
jgi:CBS-domain-containing membrane protein